MYIYIYIHTYAFTASACFATSRRRKERGMKFRWLWGGLEHLLLWFAQTGKLKTPFHAPPYACESCWQSSMMPPLHSRTHTLAWDQQYLHQPQHRIQYQNLCLFDRTHRSSVNIEYGRLRRSIAYPASVPWMCGLLCLAPSDTALCKYRVAEFLRQGGYGRFP